MPNIITHWCAVDELYLYWIDRLNVAEGSTVVLEHEEAWNLKGFLEESRAEHTKVDHTDTAQSKTRRPSRHVPIRFETEVIDQAMPVAERDGLTVSSWIRRLVQRELEKGQISG